MQNSTAAYCICMEKEHSHFSCNSDWHFYLPRAGIMKTAIGINMK